MKAEAWATTNDVAFVWEEDAWGDLDDHALWCNDARRREQGFGYNPHEACTHEVEWCAAQYHGAVLASLGGIIDADRTYRRVVEAELAREAQADAEAFTYY